MRRRSQRRRNGITVLECAVIFPALFLLVVGLIVGAIGVFRYQEMAALAREGARWASVRGATYELKTGNKAATQQDVYEEVIVPKAVALDKSQLTCSVTWNPDNREDSLVTVRLDYQWMPEAFLGGIKLSSTATALVSY